MVVITLMFWAHVFRGPNVFHVRLNTRKGMGRD
jgi:hypothetical protein